MNENGGSATVGAARCEAPSNLRQTTLDVHQSGRSGDDYYVPVSFNSYRVHDGEFTFQSSSKVNLAQRPREDFCGADSGIDLNSFSRKSAFKTGQDDAENLDGSPTNFSFFCQMEEAKRSSAEKAKAPATSGRYRQSSIRDYCNVTSRFPHSQPAKRIPFGDITNIADTESPKSRLQSLKPIAGKRLKRAGTVGVRRPLDHSHGKSSRTLGGARRRKRFSFNHTELSPTSTPVAELSIVSASSISISFSSSSSSPESKANASTISSSFSSKTHKRYCTAIAENAYTHLDDSTIPEAARASLHRVRSSSVLETSHLSSSSDEHSPEKLMAHYSLVTVDKPDAGAHSAFAYLGADTLQKLLKSMGKGEFCRKFVLVDCRFPYEYEGGHITSAHNLYDANLVKSFFYPEDQSAFLDVNAKIPIFYCEYSQKRGPSMALALRQSDRIRNEGRYPNIDYKEIYVLYRGYRNFYQQDCKDLCSPSNYVPMNAKPHAEYINYMRHNKNYSLYGTESRFHQQTSQRCEELIRSQLNDSFIYMAGDSPKSQNSKESSRPRDTVSNRSTTSESPILTGFNETVKRAQSSEILAPSERLTSLPHISKSQAKSSRPITQRRRDLRELRLRPLQIKAFKFIKRSLSDSSTAGLTATAPPQTAPVRLPSLADALAMEADRPPAAEIEYSMELERVTFSRMSVRSPVVNPSVGLPVLEEMPTPPESVSPL